MKLRELDAHFLGEWTSKSHRQLASVDGAQGIMFQCPVCANGKKKGGNRSRGERKRSWFEGAHYVICWFRNPRNAPPVPDSADPKPGRWYFEGDSIDTITFVGPGAASVLLLGGCKWHGFVKNGDAA